MLLASAVAIGTVRLLAAGGILMAPLPPAVLAMLLAATLVFVLAIGFAKTAVFARLPIDRRPLDLGLGSVGEHAQKGRGILCRT